LKPGGNNDESFCPARVRVDPTKLNWLIAPGNVDEKTRSNILGPDVRPVVLGGNWDRKRLVRFEDVDAYQAFVAHFERDEPWEGTAFWRRIVREIEGGRTKWGCTTPEAFRRRLHSDLPALYDEIRRNGYKSQEEIADGRSGILGATHPDDEIRMAVDRNGRLLILDGRHRLSIAKILSLSDVPAKIVLRHADWWEFRTSLLDYARERGGRIYQRIDHPDLADIPAAHGGDRDPIIARAFRESGFDPAGKLGIDVGAHWGVMCQRMEGLGLTCVALESNRSMAKVCRRLRDACGRSFEVWEGDALDYPGYGNAQVVFALNIFHHFIKTEELHRRFVTMLERMRGIELMVFQAHRADPPGQMRGAYRNYEAQEFADLVARHSGLSTVREIGVAGDGRRIFWMTR